MNNFEQPTSLSNIQNTDLLKANDRYHVVCEVSKSAEKLKTLDSEIIQQIDYLFSQFQQDDINVEALVLDIYSLSLKIELNPRISDYFSSNFQFVPFLNIVFDPPSPECQSYAFVCIATACHTQSFPYQIFDNEEVLTFLYQALSSEDPNIIDSSLQILSEVVKNSMDSRDYLLQNDIISTLESMKLTYSIAELLESLCSLDPPPPAQFIPSIAGFISQLIDGSELTIFELGLSSLLSLLQNNAEGIDADQFQNYLPIIFYSETKLVPLALKILMLTQNPQPIFPELLLGILEGENFPDIRDNLTVLLLITKLFAHFEPIWRPIVQDQLFLLLEAKIGTSKFKIDIEIIQTMMLYYDNSHLNDLAFFNILLRFSDSNEIGCRCMEQILMMIESQPSPDVFEKMIELIEQSAQTFSDLANGEDEDIAERAESILSLLEGVNTNL